MRIRGASETRRRPSPGFLRETGEKGEGDAGTTGEREQGGKWGRVSHERLNEAGLPPGWTRQSPLPSPLPRARAHHNSRQP